MHRKLDSQSPYQGWVTLRYNLILFFFSPFDSYLRRNTCFRIEFGINRLSAKKKPRILNFDTWSPQIITIPTKSKRLQPEIVRETFPHTCHWVCLFHWAIWTAQKNKWSCRFHQSCQWIQKKRKQPVGRLCHPSTLFRSHSQISWRTETTTKQ